MNEYVSALTEIMTQLGRERETVFLGQALSYPGTAMTQTFNGVPAEKLIEMPVAENMQMGISIGLAIAGYIPITVFPRWNFLLLAADQLINHLDKLELYSDFLPGVIIRVGVPTNEPMDPGPQHLGDFSQAVDMMLRTVQMRGVHWPVEVGSVYGKAMSDARRGKSTIIVEYLELYN